MYIKAVEDTFPSVKSNNFHLYPLQYYPTLHNKLLNINDFSKLIIYYEILE